jgi:hypothetical protein
MMNRYEFLKKANELFTKATSDGLSVEGISINCKVKPPIGISYQIMADSEPTVEPSPQLLLEQSNEILPNL